jgi:hypothetical protein
MEIGLFIGPIILAGLGVLGGSVRIERAVEVPYAVPDR